MKKIFIAAGLLLCSTISFSQAGGNSVYSNQNNNYRGMGNMANGVDLNLQQANSNFASVLEANIMINIKATAYVAIFSISQHGNSIEEVVRLMQARIELFKQRIASESGTWKVFVDPVALVPTYEIGVTEKKFSKTLNEQPSGFEIKKNIHITFGDHDHINRLIKLAAQAEVYDLVKVDYVIDNIDNIIEQLRQEALVILDRKKKSMEAAGMHLRFSNFGERYGSVYPLERYVSYYAYKTGVAPSFTTIYKKGTQQYKGTPQQTIQYNYAEKNKTIYYEKVSDKQFDKVINPVVGEPQVQVYLTMKASYNLYNPDTEKEQLAYDAKVKELTLREMELNLEEKKKDIELKEKQIAGKSK